MKTLFCVAVFACVSTVLPAADSSTMEKIKQFEKEWAQATVTGDASVLERFEANDYSFTDPAGVTGDKAKDISELKTKVFSAQAIDLEDMSVRVYGTVAVVTGKTTIKGGKYKGEDISGQYRFTDVWANRAGHWQVVASQATQIKN